MTVTSARMKILYFISVVSLILPCQGSNTYVVLCPEVVRPGVPFTVSVHILQSNRGNSVQVTTAILKDKEQIVSNTVSIPQGQPTNVEVTLPPTAEPGGYSLSVVGEGGLDFENSTNINLESKGMSILIQTDKAIYKPGQTVKFRALAIYPYLGVYTGEFDVQIKDPFDNIMEQWLGLSNDEYGVIQGELVTSTQPVLGEWKVRVSNPDTGLSEEKIFVIDEYVLPKFEVKLTLPSFVEESDTKLTGVVEAVYTYGKPVKGTAVITASLPGVYHSNARPQFIQKEIELDGKSDFEFSMTAIRNINMGTFPDMSSLHLVSVVTESLTGIRQNSTAEVSFYRYPVKVEFLDLTPDVFKPGLSYTALVAVTLEDGQPLRSTDRKSVTVEMRYDWSMNPIIQRMSVPANGIVEITTSVPDRAEMVNLQVYYYDKSLYRMASHSADKAESPSNNYLQVTTSSSDLTAGSQASFTVTATEPFTSYFYQVLSRGSIVTEDVVQGAGDEEDTFILDITHEMAPIAQIVVYYMRNNGEMVADSISVTVKNPFENEVSVAFNKDEAEPGEDIDVDVTASPNSYVGILAVDQSVLLLRSGNDITQDEVFEELKSYDTSSGGDPDFGILERGIMFRKKRSRSKRSMWWWGPWSPGGTDAYTILSNAGLLVMSDATVYRVNGNPLLMENEMEDMDFAVPVQAAGRFPDNDNGVAADDKEVGQEKLMPVERVRKFFPETWLWNDNITDADGQVSFSSQVPDTITSWVVSAFSVSKTAGFGVVPTTSTVKAFKPFFVSLNLPYSIIRGEEVALQAIVFNYMANDMDVSVILDSSEDFNNIIVSTEGEVEYTQVLQEAKIAVPAGEGRSVSFPLKPTRIGNIVLNVRAQSTEAADAVERILLVEAEGVAHEYTRSTLLDLTNSDQDQVTFEIALPSEDLVIGSVKAKISLVGDIMGSAMNNLDQLLKMPTGCGEQTMIGFAPDVFIYNYLEATNQDNGEVKDKAIRFMRSGYQRELTYKHSDGSFSAFGERDDSGSTWLTAFVVKSFIQAMDFIYIDPNVVVRAIIFLVEGQQTDGSFSEVGRVVDTFIQGGIKGPMAMTAYTLIALSQSNDKVDSAMSEYDMVRLQNARSRARLFLERGFTSMDDPYSVAIVTYALHLSQSPYIDTAFDKLNSLATSQAGLMYWSDGEGTTDDNEDRRGWYYQPRSAEIEITGYALLTYNQRTDIDGAVPITRWLTKQSNSFGGYSSTQDTVIALEALSAFAILMSKGGKDFTVTVTTSAMPSYRTQLQVNAENAMVLQQVELPVTSGEVMVDVTGTGAGLLQFTVSFNTAEGDDEDSFNVIIVTNDNNRNQISIATCAEYLLGETTGMAVMEVGIPSGFYAETETLTELIGATDGLKRAEQENNKAVFYFNQIGSKETCITFQVLRSAAVAKAQPATVTVYDYYKPEIRKTSTYVSSTQQSLNICEVCDDCHGCDNNSNTSNQPLTKGAVTFTVLVSLLSILLVVGKFF
ncbi:CD109 antigen-like [Ptychodera flava]|uniref:CD109 antigen-like n=1 Tax=Ptychodera flava TaxID=63121 RepID=UPI00396A380D